MLQSTRARSWRGAGRFVLPAVFAALASLLPLSPPVAIAEGETAEVKTGAPMSLRMVWPNGVTQKRSVKIQATSISSNPLFPAPLRQALNQTYKISILSNDIAGGGSRLQLGYDGVEVEMVMGTKRGAFDLAKPAETDAPELTELRALEGAQGMLMADALGNISMPTGYEEQLKPFLAGKPVLSMVLSRNGLREQVNAASNRLLPLRDVRVGESWTVEMPDHLVGVSDMLAKGNAVFRGMEIKQGVSCARIDFSCTLSLIDTPGKRRLPLTPTINKGVYKGTTWLDPVRGIEVAARHERVLDVDLAPADGGKSINLLSETKVEQQLLDFSNP